jgi:hypothetical protein
LLQRQFEEQILKSRRHVSRPYHQITRRLPCMSTALNERSIRRLNKPTMQWSDLRSFGFSQIPIQFDQDTFGTNAAR